MSRQKGVQSKVAGSSCLSAQCVVQMQLHCADAGQMTTLTSCILTRILKVCTWQWRGGLLKWVVDGSAVHATSCADCGGRRTEVQIGAHSCGMAGEHGGSVTSSQMAGWEEVSIRGCELQAAG